MLAIGLNYQYDEVLNVSIDIDTSHEYAALRACSIHSFAYLPASLFSGGVPSAIIVRR
jgi:hypothetical protein